MASSTLIPSTGKTLSPEFPTFRSHRPKSFISIPSPRIKTPCIRASAAASIHYPSLTPRQKVGVFTDNLDGWMRESVAEIVRGLNNSPLMVHVYCNHLSRDMNTASENWGELERRSPDGIILVQQLQDDIEYDDEDRGVGKSREVVSVKPEEDEDEDGTKAWGVLVQGKGKERECTRTACYLLKTCRVHSGLGLCGTHFSLVKVNNFRESAFSQMKNSWLL